MRTIDASEALDIAARRLSELEHEAGCRLELVPQSTQQIEQGWVFFYNSADFIRTGNMSDALAGNGPLFVSIDGHITELPSSKPWRDALDEMRS